MLARGEFELGAPVESDTRPLWPVVDALHSLTQTEFSERLQAVLARTEGFKRVTMMHRKARLRRRPMLNRRDETDCSCVYKPA